jgi:nickel-dependent lactate racemase
VTINLKYGKTTLNLDLGEAAVRTTVLEPGRAVASQDEVRLIQCALSSPIGSPPLSQRVAPGQQVVVVTSDVTRPCPSARLLPPVLQELNCGGVRDEDITVVFGLGSHRPHTREEQQRLVGDAIFHRLRCVDSDPSDVHMVGRTSRGTPVAVFGPVLEADARVCLGSIEYHYFVGYSGGVKAVVPGVCSVDTIQRNHRMMTEPGAVAGQLDGNPVREDIEEAGQMIGVDFILNVILDGSKRIVDAVAGHPQAAHREGCARLESLGRPTMEEPADLVVVSAGGYPKDLNLYQAQKALDNARHVVRPGGIILAIAACSDGLGNPVFEAWMRDPGGPEAIIARIRREFVLGGHKAAAIALILKQADIYMVSDLPPDLVRSIGFQPFDRPDEALHAALARLGSAPTIAVMPEGASTLPGVRKRRQG